MKPLPLLATVLPILAVGVAAVIWLGDTRTKMDLIVEGKPLTRLSTLETKVEDLERRLDKISKP